MPRSLILCIALALAAVAFAGPAADAASDNLFATVNICDTAKNPNSVGVRGRIPGEGERVNLRMRFFLQYRKQDGTWVQLKGAVSPWVALPPKNKGGWRSDGFTFGVQDLKVGQKIRTRGRVRFEWRRGGSLLHSKTEFTEGGHQAAMSKPNEHADPSGYSAATCVVTG